jgi:hypothetical protein
VPVTNAMDLLTDFFSWIAERSLGKLFMYAILALPILALLGLIGVFPKKNGKNEGSEKK